MSNLILQGLNKEQGLNVSERYTVVKTGDLAQTLVDNGYNIRSVQKQGSRSQATAGYGKHTLRLRHQDLTLGRPDLTPEIVLRNSYNGTSCFEIALGIFRLVCSNGLVVGKTFESLKVRHVGDIMPKVVAAMQKIQGQTARMSQDVALFSATQVSEAQALQFAAHVAKILVPSQTETRQIFNVQSADLLTARRSVDRATDLWTVLNVIQENAIRHGVSYVSAVKGPDNLGQIVRNNTTRAIKSLDRDFSINQAVWDYASQIATSGKILETA